jgi:hypothetical protein
MEHSLSKVRLWSIWKKGCNHPIWAQISQTSFDSESFDSFKICQDLEAVPIMKSAPNSISYIHEFLRILSHLLSIFSRVRKQISGLFKFNKPLTSAAHWSAIVSPGAMPWFADQGSIHLLPTACPKPAPQAAAHRVAVAAEPKLTAWLAPSPLARCVITEPLSPSPEPPPAAARNAAMCSPEPAVFRHFLGSPCQSSQLREVAVPSRMSMFQSHHY